MAGHLGLSWRYLVFVLCVTTFSCLLADAEQRLQCQEVTIPMCRGIGYNFTYMPNQFNHETQEEAGLEVHQFYPLVEIKCSPDLRLFLCSMYAPICMEGYNNHLPACRPVCERARAGCAPLMAQYGFQWPERMNCDKLPLSGLCVDANATDSSTASPPRPRPTRPHIDRIPPKHITADKPPKKLVPNLPRIPTPVKKDEYPACCQCKMVRLEQSSGFYNEIMTGGLDNCALNCTSPYFSSDEMTFASFWIGLWSILCCISTAMTVLTFFVDMQRFKYPERPIVFLSACYFMVSCGYIIRLIVGHAAVACDGKMIRYETTGPALCTVVFLLLYFFGMASSIWWVILSFTWFLSAGLKWGQEAIANYSQYFHVAAWLIPSVMSIAVLFKSSVDGDPIAGVCYVGNQNIDNLRGFVLAPLFIFLILGTSFLMAGFVSLFRIRSVIKAQGRGKTDKLERLMIRIGVFSVLYTVPATIVIACYFYEQHLKEQWEKSLVCPCYQGASKPEYSVFMLKYFMCLVVGITSGFWIWTGKTVDSWKKFFYRTACCCDRDTSGYSSRMSKSTNSSYPGVKALPLSQV
ncbi:frizzled-5-like [Mizuhopecten yessoensis]|uniref:Frizzled-5 n=1 Tax=Mizuhopecten yessoensis TaxID=6573 RepID=A0A210PFZ8_MIZYE|nr:frizzled-5-like [Mizuhopecten yessoensis]XP_021342539.1 frizzled-5-like [Mizuhopecten yessoensis]XP_021342540.1 frizzled-5-like [Mizuhopecten yessoensis]XP_021342541.1 frizzled-5-like [Mizuhopecten yessoensis]XP_021342542.1 frizzled-5-like [Mizuhopecten yessoensis]XP_021342544.1 frizzled-5-like [Mizuhopecten yessoensis]XP_021342545.1 frizzled-5-like [Mizuhopecten yessoensis]XP_021342546.1 frizzled-5-like [Mizuhopecten yessoensis]XP_021342547.1 frizzled-5-like [Mizuhopecten yessoensis]XP